MSFRYEIRLSGDVGHGLVWIGEILAEAAALYNGYNAAQCQSYGGEARGEANSAEVVFSNAEILFPCVQKPDLLLCLSQVAYEKYIHELKLDGILIIDSNRVTVAPMENCKVYKFPIFQTAFQEFGTETLANVIGLGIVAEFVKFILRRRF